MPTNPPVEVQQYGQSIWYDNIRRSLIHNGELKRMIDEDGVLGVTSNPTIFQKAIGDSSDYDEGMMNLLELEPYDIYERLAIEDIQNALDTMRSVYDRTEGRDGYVSLEVSPLIANDTETTVNEAKRLFAAVNRPNTMIKIPATEAGIPAIEEVIAAGINVNVTLIFSVSNYEQVMNAYIRGLERRHAAGESVAKIASVASFFVSRIDGVVDRMLDNNIRAAQGRDVGRVTLNNNLKGKAAIANAKIAYKRFRQIFDSERFAALKAAGAWVQRPLWASTGTKNPAYPDTLYVDNLIGPDTVNTVPPDTLKAFKDHGTAAPTLTADVDDAEQTMDMLAEVGVDLDAVTRQLQIDGVEAFSDSFHSLLDQVDAKRNILATGVIKRQTVAIGTHHAAVEQVIKDLDSQHINARIWEKDATVWKDHPNIVTKIKDRLGWLDVFSTIDIARLKALQAQSKDGDFDHVVLLGMGGSSLAPEVLNKAFGEQPGFPRLLMLDSTDPTYIRHIESQIDLKRTVFIVASKSGGTIETASFFKYFYERTGNDGAHFIAITDANTSLEKEARDKNFRDVFVNPSDIGGRYSALSYFGMVPAALVGLPVEALWASAQTMAKACGKKIRGKEHPGITLGTIMGVLAKDGRDKVSIHASPSIADFGSWVEQLIAESTGKEGVGILPVVGATIGKPHDYATDRLFVCLRVDGDDNAALDEGITALQQAGYPTVSLALPDKAALGGEFLRWEWATVVAGKLLNINPFDEPNVTESKQNTGRLLDHFKEHGALPTSTPVASEDGVSLYIDDGLAATLRDTATQHHLEPNLLGLLATQINATNAGDYFALLAYLPMFPEIDEVLNDIRRRIRHCTRRAVTVGYGPRFLHSTGQLHKGGANNGVFIQITCNDPSDIAIPGEPYSFGTLKAAQAAGDLEALIPKGRRALRLHISGDILTGLDKLRAAVDLAAERRQ
ncbi:MAG: bifunctional transaldolase/phosoglucose isomerase [Chloroflexota bacterium]|nr:bifunctional transaldolase/phosoglucose isomerase [Chloroflexota bacterium]